MVAPLWVGGAPGGGPGFVVKLLGARAPSAPSQCSEVGRRRAKGQGKFAAEWMLVVQKVEKNARWILKPMNFCMNYFGNGEVKITNRGNFKIGRITMQRKGGDGGRDTAKMLQFKINPAELFCLI